MLYRPQYAALLEHDLFDETDLPAALQEARRLGLAAACVPFVRVEEAAAAAEGFPLVVRLTDEYVQTTTLSMLASALEHGAAEVELPLHAAEGGDLFDLPRVLPGLVTRLVVPPDAPVELACSIALSCGAMLLVLPPDTTPETTALVPALTGGRVGVKVSDVVNAPLSGLLLEAGASRLGSRDPRLLLEQVDSLHVLDDRHPPRVEI